MHKANGSQALKQRRADAAERQAERSQRSTYAQIDILDARLGKDMGAKKERLRLVGGPVKEPSRKSGKTKKQRALKGSS